MIVTSSQIVDFVLICGQSNAVGNNGAAQPEPDRPIIYVDGLAPELDPVWYRRWVNSGTQIDQNPNLLALTPYVIVVGPGQGFPKHSVELAFADKLVRAGRRVAVCKVARGSTSAADWLPSGSDYPLIPQIATDMKVQLATYYPNATYRHWIIWIQGETDARSTTLADAYEANWTAILSQMIVDFAPVRAYDQLLSATFNDAPDNAAPTVNAAKISVAAASGGVCETLDPDSVAGFLLQSDAAHETSSSYHATGAEYGDRVLGV